MGEINVSSTKGNSKQWVTIEGVLDNYELILFSFKRWQDIRRLHSLAMASYFIQQTVEFLLKIQLQEATKDQKSMVEDLISKNKNGKRIQFEDHIKTHDISVLYSTALNSGCKFVGSDFFYKMKGILTDFEHFGRYYPNYFINEQTVISCLKELNKWIPAVNHVFNFSLLSDNKSFIDFVKEYIITTSPDELALFLESTVVSHYKAEINNLYISIPTTEEMNRKCKNFLNLDFITENSREDDSNGQNRN